MGSPEIGIVGYGKVGGSYHEMFPEAVIYDPYVEEFKDNKEAINECDVALVCVPTDLDEHTRKLDMGPVNETVGWLKPELIIIKSALQPGTADRLVEQTGKKIAVSVEYVGEGSYFVPFWKYPDTKDPTLHDMVVVGGSDEAAESAAEVLWDKLSPDIRIHKVTALEAEIIKLVENSYGAYKVTFANAVKSLCDQADASWVRVHQGWTSDGRVDAMHTRTTSFNRGWSSKCWDKDVIALQTYAEEVGAIDLSQLIGKTVMVNNYQLELNNKDDE